MGGGKPVSPTATCGSKPSFSKSSAMSSVNDGGGGGSSSSSSSSFAFALSGVDATGGGSDAAWANGGGDD